MESSARFHCAAKLPPQKHECPALSLTARPNCSKAGFPPALQLWRMTALRANFSTCDGMRILWSCLALAIFNAALASSSGSFSHCARKHRSLWS